MGLGNRYTSYLGVRRRLDYDSSSLLIEKVISDHCKKQLGSLEKFTEEKKNHPQSHSIIPPLTFLSSLLFLSLCLDDLMLCIQQQM